MNNYIRCPLCLNPQLLRPNARLDEPVKCVKCMRIFKARFGLPITNPLIHTNANLLSDNDDSIVKTQNDTLDPLFWLSIPPAGLLGYMIGNCFGANTKGPDFLSIYLFCFAILYSGNL